MSGRACVEVCGEVTVTMARVGPQPGDTQSRCSVTALIHASYFRDSRDIFRHILGTAETSSVIFLGTAETSSVIFWGPKQIIRLDQVLAYNCLCINAHFNTTICMELVKSCFNSIIDGSIIVWRVENSERFF